MIGGVALLGRRPAGQAGVRRAVSYLTSVCRADPVAAGLDRRAREHAATRAAGGLGPPGEIS